MTENVVVQFGNEVARKDVRFFTGEALAFHFDSVPTGASVAITIAEHSHQSPLLQHVTQDSQAVLATDDLAALPEGQSCVYNIWLLANGEQELVQYGSLTSRSTILPENLLGMTTEIFSADTPPTLLIDGDSVMAHTGFRDLLVSTTGDVALVPPEYNQAVGGHTIIDMLDSAGSVIERIVPDNTIVVVGPIGANRELNATVEDHRAQIQDLFDRYVAAGATVVAVPTLPDGRTSAEDVNPYGNDAYYAELAQIIRDIAALNPSVIAVDVSGFDPVTMKDDRTHPNVSHGATYLAEQTASTIRSLVAGNRMDNAANRLGALATLDGDTPAAATGVSGIVPTGWQATRAVGTGNWTISRGVNNDLIVSITDAPDKGQLQLRADVTLEAATGEIFDSIFEVSVDAGSTGFNGIQTLTIDGSILGGYFDVAVANPPTETLYPHAKLVALTADRTTVPAILRLSVAAGGSVTYRVTKAGLFKVDYDLGTTPVILVPPTNTSLPTIDSMTPVVGDTLTASNGTWSGSPSAYATQWLADGVAISGATENMLTVGAELEGAAISVSVIATNTDGQSAPAVSAATSAVIAPVASAIVAWDSQINSPAPEQLAYSDNDRTVSATAAINGMRHTRGATAISGTVYFEIGATVGVNGLGISGDTIDYATGGQNGVSRCYWSGAYVFHTGGSSFMGSGNTIADGDIIQIAVDTTTSQFWLRKAGDTDWNNNAAADPVTSTSGFSCSGMTGAIYPYVNLKNDASAQVELHGSSDRIAGSAPAGYGPIG